jgi:thiol:disulfide interchange protein DsbD
MLKHIYLLIFLFILTQNVLAKQTRYVKVGAQLVEQAEKTYLAINFKNEKGWHTYWKNPGDAGLAIDVNFSNELQQINLKALEWPVPKRYIEQGNLWAYGYSGVYSLFYHLNPDHIKTLQKNEIKLTAKWLVCLDICIPEKHELMLRLNGKKLVVKNSEVTRPVSDLVQSLNQLPQLVAMPETIELYLNQASDQSKELVLNATIRNFDPESFDYSRNLLTPFPAAPFGFKHEYLYYDSTNQILYAKFPIEWDGDLQEPAIDFPVSGSFAQNYSMRFILNLGVGKSVIIEQDFNQFSTAGQKSLDEFYSGLTQLNDKPEKKIIKKDATNQLNSLLLPLIFAFLGGLILNLMPCVLPVISFKLFGLIAHNDESPKKILKHNLIYTLGVVSTFWLLAAIIIIIKNSGEQIGWGFQLQSPIFVAMTIIVLFILSLNLFGLFEFKTPLGKKLGTKELKRGFTGDFLSGVFATILSTPCSAPFLGSALTFAFTTTNINSFIVFTMIGIGLAFPFIMTGIFPATIKMLPKPGAWMEKLKQFLGLTLLLTIIWLYDVLVNLVDFSLLGIYFNTLLALIFFAIYFTHKIAPRSAFRHLFKAIAVLFFIYMLNLNLFEQPAPSSIAQNRSGELGWDIFSQARLDQEKQAQNYVFIDFTAKWCLTCKVNKKMVLETDDFKKLAIDKKLTLLVGDWTKKDDHITRWLKQYDVVGVPAYFIQTPEGRIIPLGEIISVDKIRAHIK